MDAGGPVHNGEVATDESSFVETARLRVCPREGQYGIQVPLGHGIAWSSMNRARSSRPRTGLMGNKDCRLTVGKGYGFLRPDGGKPAELERATFGRESGPIVRSCHSNHIL